MGPKGGRSRLDIENDAGRKELRFTMVTVSVPPLLSSNLGFTKPAIRNFSGSSRLSTHKWTSFSGQVTKFCLGIALHADWSILVSWPFAI